MWTRLIVFILAVGGFVGFIYYGKWGDYVGLAYRETRLAEEREKIRREEGIVAAETIERDVAADPQPADPTEEANTSKEVNLLPVQNTEASEQKPKAEFADLLETGDSSVTPSANDKSSSEALALLSSPEKNTDDSAQLLESTETASNDSDPGKKGPSDAANPLTDSSFSTTSAADLKVDDFGLLIPGGGSDSASSGAAKTPSNSSADENVQLLDMSVTQAQETTNAIIAEAEQSAEVILHTVGDNVSSSETIDLLPTDGDDSGDAAAAEVLAETQKAETQLLSTVDQAPSTAEESMDEPVQLLPKTTPDAVENTGEKTVKLLDTSATETTDQLSTAEKSTESTVQLLEKPLEKEGSTLKTAKDSATMLLDNPAERTKQADHLLEQSAESVNKSANEATSTPNSAPQDEETALKSSSVKIEESVSETFTQVEESVNDPAGSAHDPVTMEQLKALPPDWRVAVLCYTQFSAAFPPKAPRAVSADELKNQIGFLRANGFKFVPMSLMIDYLRGAPAPMPNRAVAISLDETHGSAMRVAAPILQRENIPFAMFVNPKRVDAPDYATSDQIREALAAGAEIHCHALNVEYLPKKDKATLVAEFKDAKERINKEFQIAVRALSYPHGAYDAEVIEAAREAKFDVCFTRTAAPALPIGNQYAAPRYMVRHDTNSFFNGFFLQPLTFLTAATPKPGSIISKKQPRISAQLLSLANLSPASIKAEIEGVGIVPSEFDAASRQVTVTLPSERTQSRTEVRILAEDELSGNPILARWQFFHEPNL